MQSHRLSHDDYTVGWICALSSEFAAAKAMLDSTHPGLPQVSSDHNSYALGEIAGHNVVIACLPAGVYGTTSATSVAKDMLSTYREIRYGLMVGIGGGAPSRENDIRLGDVVVSQPSGSSGGVIQYDHGKTMTGGQFEPTGSMNKPPALFLNALSNVKSEEILGRSRLHELVSQALERYTPMSHFTYPGPAKDILFRSEYAHSSSAATCNECDRDMQIIRAEREGPRVFYGLVASANQVMKDSITRDRLAREHGILCFEMEAAGLMDHFPCLVIRGICDYSDSHKHKDWQEYAALTAAAYAKCVLLTTSVDSTRRCQSPSKSKKELFQPTPDDIQCLKALFLTDPEEDRASLRRSRGERAQGTCEWILQTEEVTRWLKGGQECESHALWLYGNPGTGKSTIATTLSEKIPMTQDFISGNGILSYFFCDSAHDTRRTATAILRGLLYQFQKQCPHFLEHFRPPFLARGESMFDSFDTLWSVFLNIIDDDSTVRKYCIIDALDECDDNSQHILLSQLDHYYRNTPQKHQRKVHILVTSRPYPEIFEYLQSFPHKDLAQYLEREKDIKRMISEKVQELTQKKAYTDRIALDVTRILLEKAEGTFLWIGIACQELSKIRSRDAVKALQKLPRGLDSLYRQLLASAIEQNQDDEQKITMILHFVAVARTAMTVSMLSHACQSYADEPEEERLSFFREDIKMCRLMVIIQDDYVQLLHKSVKDFLLDTQKGGVAQGLKAHAMLPYRCIDYIINWASSGKASDEEFLAYAAASLPAHAHSADAEFSILDDHKSFYSYQSASWMAWHRFRSERFLNDLDITNVASYTIFHAAAQWNIAALARLGLNMLKTYLLGPRSLKYNDREFKGFGGQTPLGFAAVYGSTEIMSMLLENADVTQGIRNQVVFEAAQNQECAYDIFTIFFDKFGDSIRTHISEGIIRQVANNRSGSKIIELIAERCPESLGPLVTPAVIRSAIFNRSQNLETVAALLPHTSAENISTTILETAMRCKSNGREVAVLLFSHANLPNVLTEQLILVAASHSTELCHDLIRMALKDQDKAEASRIPTELYHLIVHWCDLHLINLFLRALQGRIIISESMISAARNEDVKNILAAKMEAQELQDPAVNEQFSRLAVEDGSSPAFLCRPIKQTHVLHDHTDEVWCSAFSRDGLKFASGGRDHVIRIYDSIAFKPVGRLLDHDDSSTSSSLRSEDFIFSLGWSPDGGKLVSGSYNGTIRIWNVETHECLFKSHSNSLSITGISWTPDGRSFVSCSHDTWLCHWTDSGSILHTLKNTPQAQCSSMTPDGSQLVLAHITPEMSFYDLESYTKTKRIYLEGKAFSIRIEYDTNLALLDLASGELQTIDLTSGRVVQRFQSARIRTDYALVGEFFGEGNSLVLGCSENGRICVWDRHTASILDVLDRHAHGCVNSISTNPVNPNMFISTGDDCTVRVWEMSSTD